MRAFGLIAALGLVVAPVLADWNPGEPYKMHFPQLPNPAGWDVKATFPKVLADDWECTETGPVTDIHFWGSWKEDRPGQILKFHLSIHDDDPGPPSKPRNLLWERDFVPGQWKERQYGTGPQGWYDPNTGQWNRPDHNLFYQYNFVNIPNPFVQKLGTIYWLDVSATVTAPAEWGWKTSIQHFRDDAVWGDFPDPKWQELKDPITHETLDLAFVITPEPAALSVLVLGGLVLLRRR